MNIAKVSMWSAVMLSVLGFVTAVSAQTPFAPRVLKGQAAHFWAQQRGLPVEWVNDDGGRVSLREIRNDFPIYITQFNRDSAQMMGTFDVGQPPESGNPHARGLRGNGVLLGIWDGGAVYSPHPHLNSSQISLRDATPYYNEHATHVAGTMVGLASVRPDAGGMADEATLWSYDWDRDVIEMANAASQGMVASNHSYGEYRGWDFAYPYGWIWFGDVRVSAREDYLYGFYSTTSQEWDEVLYNNPYLVAVSASGNSRDTAGPANGEHYYIDFETENFVFSSDPRNANGNGTGYDTLDSMGVAKNGVTVGAIKGTGGSDPYGMSDFACWGPTDDGRIKPDVVAKGVSVLSSTFFVDQDTSDVISTYESWNGTSMASPGICGSLGVVFEHWANETAPGDRPRSATVRALLAHTAKDLPLGSPDGPDYRFGWGLMDTIAIVETISEAFDPSGSQAAIIEATLPNASEALYLVTVEAGDALSATLAWTDPPGTPVAAALNPRNPMLVNQLDLEITRLSDNQNFYPYRLDPTNPAAPAQNNAPNRVDNLERIDVPSTDTIEIYQIRVHHDGDLHAGQQMYSLVITGGATSGSPEAPLVINSPVQIPEGGESTFGVRLPIQPTAPVTVEIKNTTANSVIQVVSGYRRLLFTPDNWNLAQDVRVAAAADDPPNACIESAVLEITRDDLEEAVTLLPVSTVDTDLSAVISKTAIEVDEGSSEDIRVRLSDSPCDEVQVFITQVSGSSAVKVIPDVLTFDDSNYNMNQVVEFIAGTDPGDYRDEQAIFELTMEDRDQAVPLSVLIWDADALRVEPGVDDLSVTEGSRELRELGAKASGRVVPIAMSLPPASGETLRVWLERTPDSDPDIYIWDPMRDRAVTSYTFEVTANNWLHPLDLRFVASDDNDSASGTAQFRVTYPDLPNPNRYGQILELTEKDSNELRPVILLENGNELRQSVLRDLQPGILKLFIQLNIDPGKAVTVRATPLNGTSAMQILTDPAEFIFNSDNWDEPQLLEIEVKIDADNEPDSMKLRIDGEGLPVLYLELHELERLAFTSPPPPVLTEPQNNALIATDSIMLRWVAVELAETYDLYIGNTPVPIEGSADKYTLIDPEFELTGLEPGMVYYWRVIANNPVGSAPSPIYRFSTPLAAQPVNNSGSPIIDQSDSQVPDSDQDAAAQDQADQDPNNNTGNQSLSSGSSGGVCGVPTLLTLGLGLIATWPRRRR
jgi:hypothetical protein